MLIGTPIGILAGTYMAEYGRYDRLTSVVRFINDILLSAPSIVIGLFVYELMVGRWATSPASPARVALAVIVIPVVVRTTEDMLLLVPDQLREAAAALGMPRAYVIRHVAYRAAQRRHHHRRAAGGRPHQRRDGAAAVHRAQQPVLEHQPQRADGEPAGRDLPVRAEPLSELAAARLDRRAAHHRSPCSPSASSRARLRLEQGMHRNEHVNVPTSTTCRRHAAGLRRARRRSATSISSTATTGR